MFDHPIGARVVLPDHILKNKAVVALVGGSHGAYTDNLCFVRCLAVHRGVVDVKDLETPAKTYYRQYLQQQDMTPADFKGVTLDDLVVLEQVYSLNVYVYDLQETEAGDIAARLVRRSPYKYDDTMNLNLYMDHFSYIKDLRSYSKTYYCFGKEDKFSCKGINKRTNQITKDKYMDVLLTKQSGSGTSRGFRAIDNKMYTYLQERAGFSYFYPKRKVLADGVSTTPLDI